jgi:Domain of unknown function (DUF1905)
MEHVMKIPRIVNKATPLNVSFTATLEGSSQAGGWVYVVWPESVEFFGTKGLVKVEGSMDSVPFNSAFMALGDGRHKLPVKEEIRRRIDRGPGDEITIALRARLN